MHISERRAKDNIYKSAEAHGISGLSLDGNDVGVFTGQRLLQLSEPVPEGPTLLECRTYRWRGHVRTFHGHGLGVQRKDEMTDWLPKDPLARAKSQLLEKD